MVETVKDTDLLRRIGVVASLAPAAHVRTRTDKAWIAFYRSIQLIRRISGEVQKNPIFLLIPLALLAVKVHRWTQPRTRLEGRNVVVVGGDHALGAAVGIGLAK
jgi:hypothetical protein